MRELAADARSDQVLELEEVPERRERLERHAATEVDEPRIHILSMLIVGLPCFDPYAESTIEVVSVAYTLGVPSRPMEFPSCGSAF